MKRTKNLFTFLLLTVCVFSCTDFAEENELSDMTMLQEKLKDYITDFKLLQLDTEQIYESVKEQSSDLKSIVLIEDELSFHLKISSYTPEITFQTYDEELKATESSILFLDNLTMENRDQPIGFSISPEVLYGEFHGGDGDQLIISSANDFVEDAQSDTYVLYKSSDVIDRNLPESSCHFEDPSDVVSDDGHIQHESRQLYDVGVTVIVDYSFYQYLGFNGAVNYVINGMYWTNFRFHANSGLPIDIIRGNGYVLNRPDQYGLVYSSNPSTYLRNFASFISRDGSGNDAEILFTRDHAHWGAAWPNSVCGYYGNALVEYHSWTTRRYNILAHELGHILGASHTSSGVMRTVANGSSSFTSYSKNQILNFLSYAGWCL